MWGIGRGEGGEVSTYEAGLYTESKSAAYLVNMEFAACLQNQEPTHHLSLLVRHGWLCCSKEAGAPSLFQGWSMYAVQCSVGPFKSQSL